MFRILLIISGGVAAYKSLLLIRLLKQAGIQVRCIMTKSAQHFVTPLSVSSLSGEKVYLDLFSLIDEAEMGHIQLSRSADLVVVVPATANLLAKMAAGLADDLASTALMATDKPVMVVPSMNVRMYAHPATQRNIQILHRDGVRILGPVQGAMACGEYGYGRMVEPETIFRAIQGFRERKNKIVLMVGKFIYRGTAQTVYPSQPKVDDIIEQLFERGYFLEIIVGLYTESIHFAHRRVVYVEDLDIEELKLSRVIALGTWDGAVPTFVDVHLDAQEVSFQELEPWL